MHSIHISSHFFENDWLYLLAGGPQEDKRCFARANTEFLLLITSGPSALPSHSNRATVKPYNVRRLSALTGSLIHIFHVRSVKYEQMKTIGAFLPFLFAVQLQQSTAGPCPPWSLLKTKSFVPREAHVSLKRMCQKPSSGFLLDSFWLSCWHW